MVTSAGAADVCCFSLDEKPDDATALIRMKRPSNRGATKGV
jgi:hypothetical protein